VRTGRKTRYENLETRELLAAITAKVAVFTSNVGDQSMVTEWRDTAIGAEEMVVTLQPWTHIKSMSYGIQGPRGGVDSGVLKADLTGRDGTWGELDGYYETTLATDQVAEDGKLSFNLPGWGMQIPEQGLPLQVEMQFHDTAPVGKYRLNEPALSVKSSYGRVQVLQFGYKNPTITVQQCAELNVGIDGPASQTISPDDDDVVLARVNFDASEALNTYSIPVLLEGSNAGGQTIDAGELVTDVELRNVVTGQTIDAVMAPGDYGDSQLYLFESFVLDQGRSTWEIRVDMTGGESGDRVRASVLDGVDINNRWWGIQTSQLDGNGPVETSPGGTISGNWQEISVPHVTVTPRAMQSSLHVVENQKNVEVFVFDVYAEGAKDLLTTAFAFEGEHLVNGQNYAVWFDSDKDGSRDVIIQDGIVSVNGEVHADNLVSGGIVVPAGSTDRFWLTTDIASSSLPAPDNTLQVWFASQNPVEAETLDDGASLTNNQFTIASGVGVPVTIYKHGTFRAEQDSMLLQPRLMLGGAQSESLVSAEFGADLEAGDVYYVGLDVEGDAGSIDRFELFVNGSAVPLAVATPGGAEPGDDFGARMNAQQLIVGAGEEKDVAISARIKSDVNGGVSGDTFTVVVDTVYVRGVTSSSQSTLNVDIRSPEETVVMSKLTSVTNAGPTTAAMPSGVAEIGSFQFVAAANVNTRDNLNRVDLDQLTFEVNTLNVELDTLSFALYNKANAALTAIPSTVVVLSPGCYRVTFTDLRHSAPYVAIGSGASATFGLRVNVTNPNTAAASGGESSLRTTLDLRDDYFSWFDEDFGTSTQINGTGLADDFIRGMLLQG